MKIPLSSRVLSACGLWLILTIPCQGAKTTEKSSDPPTQSKGPPLTQPLCLTQSLDRVVLVVDSQKIEVAVANSQATRKLGLMHCQHLADNTGMLFVFPEPQMVAMWMKDTPIPLSVAFLDSSGRILNIEDMVPYSLEQHPSAAPALYALETPLGWFKRSKGMTPVGAQIRGLSQVGKAGS